MPINLASIRRERPPRRVRLIVYDLDGTLFETLPDLHTAVNMALAERGHGAVTLETVRGAIGDGVRSLIARVSPPNSSKEEIDHILDAFGRHYLRVCGDHSSPRKGALEFVARRAVPDRFQAILTNKPQAPTDLLFHRHGLDKWIGRALGGDTNLGRKPDPAGLLDLMAWAGSTAAETVVIGDGPADLAVAQVAGTDSICIGGGYGDRSEVQALPATWRVTDFEELESVWEEIDSQPRHVVGAGSH